MSNVQRPAPALLVAVALVLLSIAALVHLDTRRYADPDLFVTLYTGREIVATGEPPRVESHSFTAAGGPWRDYEWVSRLVFYRAHESQGAAGLVALRAAVAVGLFAVAGLHALRLGSAAAFAAGVVFLSLFLRELLLFRPRIATFLGLACVMLLLDVGRSRRAALFGIPPLVAVWVNLHAGVIVGIAGIACLFGESVVRAVSDRFADALPGWTRDLLDGPTAPMAASAALLVASFLATGANPYGFEQWTAVVHSFTSAGTGGSISEWVPLARGGWREAILPSLLIATVLASLWIGRKRIPLGEAVFALVLCVASIAVVRFVALLAVVGVFPFMRAVATVAPGLAQRLGRSGQAVAWTGAAGAALVFALVQRPVHLDVRMFPSLTPVEPVAFLQANDISGNVLNEYDWGGYLAWAMPESRIFVDGRYDTAYPPEIYEDWSHFVTATYDYPSLPDRYGADVVLLRRIHVINAILDQDPRWVPVYRDPHSAIWLRRSEANAKHLARFEAGTLRVPELSDRDFLLGRTPPRPSGGEARDPSPSPPQS